MVSPGYEIRDTSLDTWPSLLEEKGAAPSSTAETSCGGRPQCLPRDWRLLEQFGWQALGEAEAEQAWRARCKHTSSTEGNEAITRSAVPNVKVENPVGGDWVKAGRVGGWRGGRERATHLVLICSSRCLSPPSLPSLLVLLAQGHTSQARQVF